MLVRLNMLLGMCKDWSTASRIESMSENSAELDLLGGYENAKSSWLKKIARQKQESVINPERDFEFL